MKKIIFKVQKRARPVFMSLSLFALIFLFAGIGQTAAQSDAAAGASPYGAHIFVSAPEALDVLQYHLIGLYSQLGFLTEGTKPYKRKQLEILCYKGIISDVMIGEAVTVAYENNLAILSNALNVPEDPTDLTFLRDVQGTLFELLTN